MDIYFCFIFQKLTHTYDCMYIHKLINYSSNYRAYFITQNILYRRKSKIYLKFHIKIKK